MKNGSIKLVLSSVESTSFNEAETTHLGVTRVEPNGFLKILETRLGVNTPAVSFTSRLVEYLSCLEQSKTEDMFFSRSYKADPFAVARKLLVWRDELYMAGWTGSFADNSNLTKRLTDLAVIEAIAKDRVEPGLGERWQYVLRRLQTDSVYISKITLLEPFSYFDPLVTRTIQAAGAVVETPTSSKNKAAGQSDLDQTRSRILSDGPAPDLSGDGSLILIETENFSEAALLTSQIIAQGKQIDPSIHDIVICQNGGALLDEKFESFGLPRAGFSENSPWRPTFQVLPLAIELLWDPVSPRKLIQFLTNPVCPLPSWARYRLGNLVSEKPGIGSEDWTAEIESIIENEKDKAKSKKLKHEIHFWLECERFDPDTGIETLLLVQRIQAVSSWLGQAMSLCKDDYSQSLFAMAKGQAEDLSNAVQRLSQYNDGYLTRALIRRLVDDVRGIGAPVIDRAKEITGGQGALHAVRHPGSVHENAHSIIWTGPSGGNLFQLPFVTDQERVALSALGINFAEEKDILKAASEQSLRPLLKTKSRLILIATKDRTSDHPLWLRIKVKCPKIKVLSVEEALNDLSIVKTKLLKLSLPIKQREWTLPSGLNVPRPEYSSYSSLDKFLYKPHQWMLSYPARINTGSLIISNEGNLLKGKLAHRLIEIYLDKHKDLQNVDIAAIDSWTEKSLPKLLSEEGAVLLESGAFREHVEFLGLMKIALRNLITQLVTAGISKTETETRKEEKFIGGPLQGSIDILAETPDGKTAIIDVKYSGLRYRRDEIQKSQYLQLATYDRLNGGSPYLSYFIVREAQMLNLAHDFFKQGERVDPESGMSLNEYWNNIELMWTHRNTLLEKGIIEVPVDGTEPTERSVPSGVSIEIPDTNDAFSDYTSLTGWEAGS